MRLLFLILAGIIGIIAFAAFVTGEIGLGILFCLILAFVAWLNLKFRTWKLQRKAKKLLKQRQRSTSSTPPVLPAQSSPPPASFTASGSQQHPQWIPVGTRIDIGEYQIFGGVYLSNSNPDWDREPSTITTQLPVGNPLEPQILTASYHPEYANLLPNEKATYLWWLQQLALGNHPPNLQKGYLFIHFYGFERRVLFEGDHSSANLDAVRLLLQNYGPHNSGSTFVSYLADFLTFVDFQSGIEPFRQRWPENLSLTSHQVSENSLALILANLFQRNESLPAEIAFLISSQHDKSRSSVVIKRTREKFRELFLAKFQKIHPAGIALKAAKREKIVQYRPANRSLLIHSATSFGVTDKLALRVPNILGLSSQFKSLPGIWNDAIDELSSYSRALRALEQKPDQSVEAKLKAYLALPPELQNPAEHPLKASFEKILSVSEKESEYPAVPVSTLASLVGLAERPTLTAKQSSLLTEITASLGYLSAPNPTHMGIPLKWDQELLLLATKSELDSDCPHLRGVLRLLYLTIMIAAADGEISESEMQPFLDTLDSFTFTPPQKQEIKLTMQALQRDSKIAIRSLNKIAKSIAPDRRLTVLSHLVKVATDDEIVTPEELKVLKRCTKAMSLEPDVLDQLLTEHSGFQTVEVIPSVPKKQGGEKISPRPQKKENATPAFSLDQSKISAISQETDEVVARLVDVLSTDETPEEFPPAKISSPDTQEIPDWMEDLEPAFQAPLLALLNHPSPTSQILEEISNDHHLIPTSLIDEINQWSDETLGDFLIELDQDDQLTIFKDLIPDSPAP